MIAVAGINFQSTGFKHLSRNTATHQVVAPVNDAISGLVLVQTCNRIEIYADINLHCKKSAERLLLQQLGFAGREQGVYIFLEDEAILHLFKVASGLDSAILGEDQILSQLKQAFKYAADHRLNSPILNKLFHKAFETGKNVRNLTSLNKGNISAASIAVGLLQSFRKEFPTLKNSPVLIIGAGETGALVAQVLAKKGFRNIQVWNRTEEKAKALATAYGAMAIPVKSLPAYYLQASMVVVAIRKKSAVLNFGESGPGKTGKRIIIDLSLPFQVPGSIQTKDCYLYNLEAIAAISQENTEKRKEAIDDAMQLVWASLHEFKAWKEQEWIGQSLQQWQLLLQQVRERQLKLFSKQHPGADLATLSAFAQELSGHLLKQLAWTLRQQEKESTEGMQWSRLLSTVEPYEQLN